MAQTEGQSTVAASEVDEHEQARRAAEALFPYEPPDAVKPLPIEGTREVHTFNSAYYKALPPGFRDKSKEEKLSIADSIIERLGAENLGIGWMAVVERQYFLSFVEQMSGKGKGSGLWQVYDIEIVPMDETWTESDIEARVPDLNKDETTADIYEFMTPRSWN